MKYYILILCFISLATFASAKSTCVGCTTHQQGDDLKKSEEVLQNSLSKLAAGDGPLYTLKKVISATTQVVSGTKDIIIADLIDDSKKEKTCKVTIWSQPWLPNGTQVDFDCPGEERITKHHD